MQNRIFLGVTLGDKVRVYVYSLRGISTLDFVDRESMAHPCATQDGRTDRIFAGFRHLPTSSWDECLSEDQRKIVGIVKEFCKENALEHEIVDIADSGFTSKMKFVFQGIRAPMVTFREKKIRGVPTKDDLKALIAR